jgi:hypothetical protein
MTRTYNCPGILTNKESRESKAMPANPMVLRILLSVVCSFLIGIQVSSNLPVTAQTKEESQSDENRKQLSSQSSGEGFKINAEGSRVCKITTAIFSADEKGNGLGSSWLRIEKPLKEEDYRQVMKTGIGFSTQVPLKVNNQILKIVVCDMRSDKLSSKLIKLRNAIGNITTK